MIHLFYQILYQLIFSIDQFSNFVQTNKYLTISFVLEESWTELLRFLFFILHSSKYLFEIIFLATTRWYWYWYWVHATTSIQRYTHFAQKTSELVPARLGHRLQFSDPGF